jgi:hypothetical protein
MKYTSIIDIDSDAQVSISDLDTFINRSAYLEQGESKVLKQ